MSEKRTGLGRGLDALLPGRQAVRPSAGVPTLSPQEQNRGDKGGAQNREGRVAEAAKDALAGAREIPVEWIERNPYQTRGKLDEVALAELAASIREQGVLQPVLVREIRGHQPSAVSHQPNQIQNQVGASPREGAAQDPGGRAAREHADEENQKQFPPSARNDNSKVVADGGDPTLRADDPRRMGHASDGVSQIRYQLMAGERRWLAAQRAGLKTIPAVVKQVGDEQAMEITIIENLQREDLNPMEQARAFERLSREFRLTQEVIALKTGKDRASVGNFLRLLKLPAVVQQHIEAGALSMGHGKVLMMLTNEPAEMMERVAQKAVDEGWSVRELEEMVMKLMGPPQAAAEKAADTRDPNVKEAERELQRSLGCKVTIKDKGGRGKIILEYASIEDFDRVVEVLGK